MNYLSKALSLISVMLLTIAMAFSMEEPDEEDNPRPRSRQTRQSTQTTTPSQAPQSEDEDMQDIQFTSSSLYHLDQELFQAIESKHLKNLSEEEYACYRVFRNLRDLEFCSALCSPVIPLVQDAAEFLKQLSTGRLNEANLPFYLKLLNQLKSLSTSEIRAEVQIMILEIVIFDQMEQLDTKDQITNSIASLSGIESSKAEAIADEYMKYRELKSKLKDPDLKRIVQESEALAKEAINPMLCYLNCCLDALDWADSIKSDYSVLSCSDKLNSSLIEALSQKTPSFSRHINEIHSKIHNHIFINWHNLSKHRPKKQIINGKETIFCLPFTITELKELTVEDIELMPGSLLSSFTGKTLSLFHILQAKALMTRYHDNLTQIHDFFELFYKNSSVLRNSSENTLLLSRHRILNCLDDIKPLSISLKDDLEPDDDANHPYTRMLYSNEDSKILNLIECTEKSKIGVFRQLQKPLEEAKLFLENLEAPINQCEQGEKPSLDSVLDQVIKIHNELTSCREKMLQFIQEIEASIETLWPDDGSEILTEASKDQNEEDKRKED